MECATIRHAGFATVVLSAACFTPLAAQVHRPLFRAVTPVFSLFALFAVVRQLNSVCIIRTVVRAAHTRRDTTTSNALQTKLWAGSDSLKGKEWRRKRAVRWVQRLWLFSVRGNNTHSRVKYCTQQQQKFVWRPNITWKSAAAVAATDTLVQLARDLTSS